MDLVAGGDADPAVRLDPAVGHAERVERRLDPADRVDRHQSGADLVRSRRRDDRISHLNRLSRHTDMMALPGDALAT